MMAATTVPPPTEAAVASEKLLNLARQTAELAVTPAPKNVPIDRKSASLPTDPANLLVNFIPPTYTEVDVQRLFSPFGKILYCKVVRCKTSRKSLGYGFIKYASAGDARLAIKANNGRKVEYIESGLKKTKWLKVAVSLPPVARDEKRNLYVSGIPLNYQNADLFALFDQFGAVIEARIVGGPEAPSRAVDYGLRGLAGFVIFTSQQSAERAIRELSGVVLPGSGAPGTFVPGSGAPGTFVPGLSATGTPCVTGDAPRTGSFATGNQEKLIVKFAERAVAEFKRLSRPRPSPLPPPPAPTVLPRKQLHPPSHLGFAPTQVHEYQLPRQPEPAFVHVHESTPSAAYHQPLSPPFIAPPRSPVEMQASAAHSLYHYPLSPVYESQPLVRSPLEGASSPVTQSVPGALRPETQSVPGALRPEMQSVPGALRPVFVAPQKPTTHVSYHPAPAYYAMQHHHHHHHHPGSVPPAVPPANGALVPLYPVHHISYPKPPPPQPPQPLPPSEAPGSWVRTQHVYQSANFH